MAFALPAGRLKFSVSRFGDYGAFVWVERRFVFGYKARLDFSSARRFIMPRVCYFTGKKTTFGNQITHRGKAKYLGGVGTKVTGVTARTFKPNIQKVRAVVDGQIVRIKVSAKAIKMGLVVKPIRRKYVKPTAA